jgi:hypothetical protein
MYLNYSIFYILHYFCNSARVEQACCLSLFPLYPYRPTAFSSLLLLLGLGAAALLPFSSLYPFLLPSTSLPLLAYLYWLTSTSLPLLSFFLPATSTVSTFCLPCCTFEQPALYPSLIFLCVFTLLITPDGPTTYPS